MLVGDPEASAKGPPIGRVPHVGQVTQFAGKKTTGKLLLYRSDTGGVPKPDA